MVTEVVSVGTLDQTTARKNVTMGRDGTQETITITISINADFGM